MSMHTNPLDHVRIAAPCSADWERMTGSEQVRFCDQCKLHVYNLSGMKKREAESLIANTEGRLCVRFYTRADGTILTDNCPVGLRALKRRLSRIATATVSAVFSFLAGVGSFATLHQRNTLVAPSPEQEQTVMGAMVEVDLPTRPLPETPEFEMTMGKMAPMMGEANISESITPTRKRPKGRTNIR